MQLALKFVHAVEAKDHMQQLSLMGGCYCPVMWFLFACDMLDEGGQSRRTVSLRGLQMEGIKQKLRGLLREKSTGRELLLTKLGGELLFTGPPQVLPVNTAWATERVQRGLWELVLKGMPRVRAAC